MDVWDNMTTKWGRSWPAPHSQTQTVTHTYSATTGRNNAWYYDADGRMVADPGAVIGSIYDEAGGLREVDNHDSGSAFVQDGDGEKARQVADTNAYCLRSSVLGEIVAEIEPYDGSRQNGFVYADGQLIATQAVGAVFWQHMDPSQRSRRTTFEDGSGAGKDAAGLGMDCTDI